MNLDEVVSFFKGMEENALAGGIVGFYYILVAWTKIRDGLGINLRKNNDLNRLQQKHDFMKLRLEIENLKQNKDLDPALIDQIEQQAETKFPEKSPTEFTKTQKYVAIPILLFMALVAGSEILYPTEEEGSTFLADMILGFIVIGIIVVIGFWGIPAMKHMQSTIARRIAYIVFWCITLYFSIFFMAGLINSPAFLSFTENYAGILFLLSLGATIAFGCFDKLPFMPRTKVESEPKENSITPA